MMKYPIIVFIVLAMAFGQAVSHAEDLAPAPTVEEMAKGVAAMFPRAEGKVTASFEGRVELDIGSADGIKPGMEVLLYRGGKPIIHPVTKAVLGQAEEHLGKVSVDEVSEHGSGGTIKELFVTRIVEGDTARLSNEPSDLLVVKDGADVDPLVVERLLAALKGSGRFNVLGPTELAAGENLGEKPAADMVEGAGADNLLAVSTKSSGNKDRIVVGLRLYSRDGREMFGRTGEADVTPELYGESVMDYPLVRGDYRDFYMMENLPFRGKHMAAGDVMGDGNTDIVVSDEKDIVMYRFVDRIPRELWRRDGSVTERHLALDCADLNGNGKDEIYVSSINGEQVESFVIEYDGTSLKTVYGPCNLLFRVLDIPGRERMLIATTRGMNEAFSGVMHEYAWKDGALEKGSRLKLPGKVKDPYGFALADLIPGGEKDGAHAAAGENPFDGLEIVWVADSDYVQVLDMEGEKIWESEERYGGYETFFEVEAKGVVLPNADPRGKVKGRVLVMDDGAGGYDIVLTKNIPVTYALKRLRGYTTAEIYSLFWNGSGLEPRWSIKNIEGFIADIYVGEVIKEGRNEVLVLVEPTISMKSKSKKLPIGSVGSLANIVADRSTLMIYKIPQR